MLELEGTPMSRSAVTDEKLLSLRSKLIMQSTAQHPAKVFRDLVWHL
jgi:hypothetical protein